MKQIITLAILAALTLPASAQPKPRPARNKRATPAESSPPKRIRTYDFEADAIDGDRIRPDGTTIFGLNAARHGSLIKLRGDFVREMVKSADDL